MIHPLRIYVASSWRNPEQPALVGTLREAGHDVYDFRNPPHGRGGFAWASIDPNWQTWTADQYRSALESEIARDGFHSDFDGMTWADACVLLLPCGRSAHLEAGYMAGQGKPVIVLTRDGEEPELMALLCEKICVSVPELLVDLKHRHLDRKKAPLTTWTEKLEADYLALTTAIRDGRESVMFRDARAAVARLREALTAAKEWHAQRRLAHLRGDDLPTARETAEDHKQQAHAIDAALRQEPEA